MNIKTRLVLACMVAIGGAAALAITVAQADPPAPPPSQTGSDAPATAGNDSTLYWNDGSAPQSSSITINFPPSSGGGGGGCAGGCGGPPPPPQPVPIGSGIQLGVNNTNSSVYWPLPAGIPNSTTGRYGPGGPLAGMYTPVTYLGFSGTFQWFTSSGAPVSAFVDVGDHAAGSACTSANAVDSDSETCTKTVTIGDSRWLFTVTGSGLTDGGCALPPPPRRPNCPLRVNGSVEPAP